MTGTENLCIYLFIYLCVCVMYAHGL